MESKFKPGSSMIDNLRPLKLKSKFCVLSKLIKKENIVYIHSPHLDRSSYTFSLTHSPEFLVTKESHMLHTKHKKSCQSMSFYINKRKLTFHLSRSRIRYHRKQRNEGKRAKVKREHRRLVGRDCWRTP